MNNSASVYSESVEKKYQEYMDKYEIPEYYEFQLKTLLSLQEEYNEATKKTPEHTKSRESLLHMIQRMQLPLNVLKERNENIVKISIEEFCYYVDKPFIKELWDEYQSIDGYIRALATLPQYKDLTHKDSKF